MKKIEFNILLILVIFISVFLSYTCLFAEQNPSNGSSNKVEVEEGKDPYLKFLFEVYDIIKEYYWNELSEDELTIIFKNEAKKLNALPQGVLLNDGNGLKKMLSKMIQNMDNSQKKKFSTYLANNVLNSLKPMGRSRLYTEKDEKKLNYRVQNVNPQTQKIEPTVFSNLIRSKILCLHIKKFSPTTLDELKKEADAVDNTQGLDSLIIDLRGNIGGSIDILPYFLGPFIGNNRYAYDFYARGKYIPFKTKIGWMNSLVRYKKVIILIDGQSQSTAEVVAAVLKKYNVGVVVGTRTRGWGTVERVFKLKTQPTPYKKYSVFLAHSLTVNDDDRLIEGNGVNPLININSKNWEKQLHAYFHYPELIEAVKELVK